MAGYDDFSVPVAAQPASPYDAFSAPAAEPNETVVAKTGTKPGPVKAPPSFKSEPSYAGNDPYEGMPWYLSRNNAFGRFSRIPEYGATFGLKNEVKPLADMAVAKARQLLGYETSSKTTLSDLAAGKEATPAQSPSDVYHASKQAELAKDAASREEAGPYVSTAAELLGGFGGIGAGAAGNAATRAPGLWNATKGYFGGIGNSAKIGAGFGAVQGATSGDGTLGERLLNTAEGAAVGAGTAGALQAVAVPLGAGIRYTGNAVRRARAPVQAAYETVAGTMNEGGIDPASLQQQYSPQPSSQLATRGITPEQTVDIVSRGLQGESAVSIGQRYGLHPSTVTRYLNNYRAENPTPLNVMDMAKLQGEGLAGPTTRVGRAAANISPQPQMMQQLADRQLNQAGRANQIVTNATGGAGTEAQVRAAEQALPGRAAGIIEREYPGSTFETTAQRLDAQARAQADQNYRRLHGLPDVVADEDLGRILAQPLARRQWESARQLAEAEGEPIPSYEELTRTFGIRPQGGLGLNRKTGLPMPPEQYPVGEMPPARVAAKGAAPVAPTPYWRAGAPDQEASIIGFLRSRGGVRPSGETRAMNAETIPGLVSEKGMPPDRAREALIEAGFMREDPDAAATTSVADFHDLLARAVFRERGVTRGGEEALPYQRQEHAASRAEIASMEAAARDHLNEIGMDPAVFDRMPPAQRQEIAQRIARGAEDGRLEQQARMYFPEDAFNRLSPGERVELGRRIEAGEHPDDVFEDLAVRHENGRASAEFQAAGAAPAAIEPGALIPVRALDYFQRALRLDAQKGGTEGHALNSIRQRLLNTLDPAATAGNPAPRSLVPGFRDTMGSYRAGMEGQEALQAGYELKPELSQQSREALSAFDAMTPPQQELFRMGFARRLQDGLQNPADAAAQIDKLNTPGARQILEHIYPPDIAQRMTQGLQSEALTSRAMQMGMDMTKNLGAQSREALHEFNQMNPDQQKLFRTGFARKLMDMVSNKGEGADAVKQFSSDAVRQMIRQIFPKDVAEPLITQLSREGVTTSSLRDLFGNSTTARQILDQNKLLDVGRTAADAFTGRWHRLLENLSNRLTNDIGERTSAEILKILAETDPAKVLPILNRLAKTAQTMAARKSILASIDQARTILPQLVGKEVSEQVTAPAPQPALPAPKSMPKLLPPGYTPRQATFEAQQKLARSPGSQRVRDAVTRRLMEHGLTLEHDPASLLAAPGRALQH